GSSSTGSRAPSTPAERCGSATVGRHGDPVEAPVVSGTREGKESSSTRGGSHGDPFDDRQHGTRWYHAVQAEARLAIEIPELVLGSLAAPATHQHAHVHRQNRDVLPRIRTHLGNEGMDGEQSAVRRNRLPTETENPQCVVVVPAVQH